MDLYDLNPRFALVLEIVLIYWLLLKAKKWPVGGWHAFNIDDIPYRDRLLCFFLFVCALFASVFDFWFFGLIFAGAGIWLLFW